MKKLFSACLILLMVLTLIPATICAEEPGTLEIRDYPTVVKIKDIYDNELFSVVEEFEGKVEDFSWGSSSRMVSSRNISLYDGYYDGRKLGTALSDGYEFSTFTDISGKSIAFKFKDRNSDLEFSQYLTRTSSGSDYHFRRHMYSNGYFFITSTVYIPDSHTRNPVNSYSYCYDTINNILYMLPIELGQVNEFGEAYGYEIEETFSYPEGLTTTHKATHMIKLKKSPIVSVFYNGEKVLFDQLPVIENGRTLVPLRAIFEKIGAEITWDGDTQTVTAVKDGTEIKLTLNSTTAYKNGEALTLEVPAKSVNGRTLVPVRFIADCFGVNVDWVPDMQIIKLTDK